MPRTRRVGWVVGLVVGLVAGPPGPLAAQQVPVKPKPFICTSNCPTFPPIVTVSPAGGTFTANTPVTITVTTCDSVGSAGITVTLDGNDITSKFASGGTAGCRGRFVNVEQGSVSFTPGAHTLTVTGTEFFSGNTWPSTVSYTFTGDSYSVLVTPVQPNLGVQLGQTGTLSYTVQNTGNTSNAFTITSDCGGAAVASCGTPSPTSTGTLNPQASTTITLGYTASMTPGATGQIGIKAAGTNTSAIGQTNVTTPAPTYSVTVIANPATNVTTAVSTTTTENFTVKNTGNAPNVLTMSVTCTGAVFVSCGTPSPASTGTLLAGASINVAIQYTTSSAYNVSGTMTVEAASANTDGITAISVSTPAAPSNAPGVATAIINDFSERQLDLCLTKALVTHVAYECGDLRIVHPLPSTETFNKVRAPTLLYSSQIAHPHPIVHALVTLDSTKGTPTSVTAQLLDGNGVVRGQGTFPVASFAHGVTREISLGFDAVAAGFTTNVFTMTVQVQVAYGSTLVTYTGDEFYALVNANTSSLGHGWAVAGVEGMHIYSCRCSFVWYSGDGTANFYSNQNTGVATTFAPLPGNMTRPDTIKTDNSTAHLRFVRYAPHGVKVVFDSSGRHIATVDRLGDSTHINYTTATSTIIASIVVPTADSTGRAYTFNYSPTTGFLTSITVPSLSTQSRNVQVSINSAGDMTSITDPDNAVTAFGYRPGTDADVITSVTDPRGTIMAVTYDAAREIGTATLDSTAKGLKYTTQFANADASTLAAALDPTTVSTLLTGPRTDVVDTTRVFTNRFGEPIHIRNALGHETFLAMGWPAFPALVTQLTDALGHTIVATYDIHGNLASETDESFEVNGAHPTTNYDYDLKWDFVTLIDPPLHDSTSFTYDPNTGNRTTQHDSRGSGTLTTFSYNALKLLSSWTLPGGGSPNAIQYDATLGNLSATETRLGYWTLISRDVIGRDTMDITPIAASDKTQPTGALPRDTVRKEYDPMNRVAATLTIAPAYNSVPRQTVVVSTSYDPAGAVTATVESPSPDPNNLIDIVTSYFYDALGRLTSTVHPGNTTDSTHYDPDGNAVTIFTRRGLPITQTFDPLDHLLTRSLPQVTYGSTTVGIAARQDDPYGPYAAYTVPADVQSFTYDAVGRVTEGDNSASHVTRRYDLSGHLLFELQQVATMTTNDFTQHVYSVGYQYDLDSRRIAVTHPSQASPSATQNTNSYTYDPAGQLTSVTTPLGTVVKLGYDLQGLADTIDRPFNNFEQRSYDLDGRWVTHLVGVTGQSPSIRQETITYDARDKVMTSNNVAGINDVDHYNYSAMGHLISDTTVWTGYSTVALQNGDEPTPTTITVTDLRLYDPLGNEYSAGETFQAGNQLATASNHIWTYLQGTGQLSLDASPTNMDSTFYDQSGNVAITYTPFNTSTQLLGIPESDRITYYAADEKPARAEARTYPSTQQFMLLYTQAVEQYRYDAFGRRVLVASHRNCLHENDGECRISFVRRTVWDGNQELDEIQVPDTVGLYDLDAFTTTFDPSATGVFLGHDPNTYWGRVMYTNGSAVDQPLGVTRLDYTSLAIDDESNTNTAAPTVVFPAFDFLPMWNYHGLMYAAIFADGTHSHCLTVSGAQRCVVMNILKGDVPYNATAALPFRSWNGSLPEDKTDKTGTQYRRARLYDPNTGRFTQEDPIGLAGGLNAYGFGTGDPITFSDPFGLGPCSVQDWIECKILTVTIGAGIAIKEKTKVGPLKAEVKAQLVGVEGTGTLGANGFETEGGLTGPEVGAEVEAGSHKIGGDLVKCDFSNGCKFGNASVDGQKLESNGDITVGGEAGVQLEVTLHLSDSAKLAAGVATDIWNSLGNWVKGHSWRPNASSSSHTEGQPF